MYSKISSLINSILTLFSLAFSLATSIASLLISKALTLEFGRFLAILIAMQPLPVPISRISFPSKFSLRINLTNSSVSGLGINTELLTLNSKSIKLVFPKTY